MVVIMKYILLTASRDLLFLGLILINIFSILISNFLGNTALSEQEQMAITYAGSSIRIITNIGLIIFVCFHVKRSFDNKEIEFFLSKPVSRSKFLFSYILGFSILALLISTFAIIAMLIFFLKYKAGIIYWGISLFIETLITIGFALFAALILQSGVLAVLLTLAFYALARMMGFFIITIHHPTLMPKLNNLLTWTVESIIILISTVLPRLDLFTQSKWLVYGLSEMQEFFIVVIQCAVYIPLLFFISLLDFRRKQF